MAAQVVFYLPPLYGQAHTVDIMVDRIIEILRKKSLTVVFPKGTTISHLQRFFLIMSERHKDVRESLAHTPGAGLFFLNGNHIQVETAQDYEHGRKPGSIPFSVRSRG